MRSRILRRLFVIILVATFSTMLARTVSAQDVPSPQPPGEAVSPAAPLATLFEVTPDGFTVWRQEVNNSCSFSDHNYTLDVTADPSEMSDISYSMTNFDVDYNDAQGCEGGPEVDIMSLNGSTLGILTGANNSWSTNAWPLNQSQVISGPNQIFIDTDAPGTGCWCVGVGYIEIRARLGFKVASHTPQKDDKNRDFHAGNLDLTVSFSSAYDPATLDQNTFKLEYRDQGGAWQQINGTFTQLGPEKFRFIPGADLKDGVRYRATVKSGDAGVKGIGGGKLESDTEWYFWTVPDLSKSDAYNYGAGSVCPPSPSPCPGVELTVFQVARNATMVPNKPAVARLYLRWKKHDDVLDADQVKELEVDATLSGGGSGSLRETIKRPDQYSAAEKAAAANTVNIYHTPGSSFNYAAEITPQPQSNAAIVKYTAALNLPSSGRSPDLRFNYYFLKDGDWAGGAPAAAKTDGRNLFTNGVQFMQDVFPVLSANFTEQGDHSIGYTRVTTMTDTFAQCGTVWKVDCPGWWFFTSSKPEIQCVYDQLESMRGGHPFVAATVPSALCPNTNGMAYRKVFVHFSGSGANYGTVVHETGHIYTLGHIDTTNGIEGFQVRTKTNRSFVENPTKLASLMHTVGQPADLRWIVNSQYQTLIGTVTAAGVDAAATAAGPYLIVSGYIYLGTNTAEVAPAFLQDVPNDPPNASGPCTVELLNAADAVLASDFAVLASNVHVTPPDPNAPLVEFTSPAPFFSVSLPWDPSAAKLRIRCGGNTLLTQTRSANTPTVDFTNLAEGATLAGSVDVGWSGSDADGPNLAYQLQFSEDGGATWTPIMPLGTETSLNVDTTRLSSGANRKLRILVTDGFNTSYAVRTVTIANPLTVIGTLPGGDATGVPINTTVQALFASDVATPTLETGNFQLFDSNFNPVDGTVTYDAPARMAIFTPAARLAGNAQYYVEIYDAVADTNGNPLATTVSWSFTTGADDEAPFVVANHPAKDEVNTPINTLVQASFNEAMDAASLSSATFRLLDSGNNVVPGVVTYNAQNHTALLIPDANLQPNTTYTAQVTTGARDAGGNPLGATDTWRFTTGGAATLNGVRIIGNYSDVPQDTDGDGFYDLLRIFVDVEVRNAGYYNLNGRLTDQQGSLIQWATTGDQDLAPGVHTLTLDFSSVPIRSNGVDGSYFLDTLNFYDSYDPGVSDRRFRAFQTFPYDVEKFYSILTLGGLPDQLLEVNTTRDNAFNLRAFTSHASRQLTEITYKVLINSNPVVSVTIDGEANIDINPQPNTAAESDVSIEARDPEGNRVVSTFHVAVQQAQASRLEVTVEPAVEINQSRPVKIDIFDQFGRPFAQAVDLTLSTTLGSVDPAALSTSTATATATFLAGGTPGTAFLTVQSGTATRVVQIQVIAPQKGVIAGHIFIDLNGNGVQDGGEANAAGIQVRITPAGGGQPVLVVTDADGNYRAELLVGNYLVEVLPAGALALTTAGSFERTLAVGGAALPDVGLAARLYLPRVRR